MVKRKEIFIFLLLLILSIFFIYVYNEIKTTKKDIYARIEAHQIEQTSAVIKNIQNEFISFLNLKNSNDLRQAFSDNKNREKYEHIISLMLSSNIKYAYILYSLN